MAALRQRLDAVADAVAGRPRPRVAIVEWVDPPFTAGHWVPDLVHGRRWRAGGRVAGESPCTTTWAEIAAARRTWSSSRPAATTSTARSPRRGGRRARAAARRSAIWAIDADGLVVRPGPRLVDGVEALAALLHPDSVPQSDAVRLVRGRLADPGIHSRELPAGANHYPDKRRRSPARRQ